MKLITICGSLKFQNGMDRICKKLGKEILYLE